MASPPIDTSVARYFSNAPTCDQIARACEPAEAYRRGGIALSAVVHPARCLFFERADAGQVALVYQLDLPNREQPTVDERTITDQIQKWLQAEIQDDGLLRSTLPAALPDDAHCLVIPLVAGDLLHGVVALQDSINTLDDNAEREVVALATTLGLTLHLFTLRHQLATAHSPEQAAEAVLQDRRRIAREIHDGVAQSLAYLNLKVEYLDRLIERNPTAAHEQAELIQQVLKTATADLRRAIGDLREPTSALGEVASAQGHHLSSVQQVASTWPEAQVETTILSIVREALQNIRKHADAHAMRVEVTKDAQTLRVVVIDDGQGFHVTAKAADPGEHFGLVQMHELAQELGGEVVITSVPGSGTRVETTIPMQPTDLEEVSEIIDQ